MNRYVQRWWKLIVITILFFYDVNAQNLPNPRVLVNGVPLDFTEPNGALMAQPVNKEGNIMVPANAVLTRLGFQVAWDANEQKVTATKITPSGTERRLELWIGQTRALINGVETAQVPAAQPYIETVTRLDGTTAGYTMVHTRLIADAANSLTQFDYETQSVQIYYYDELDYGIYFYGSEPGNEGDWDFPGCQKYVPGQFNPFFDPNKPTLIYIHGIQPDNVQNKIREDFYITVNGNRYHSRDQWTEWNVGIFFWTQLADEGFWDIAPPSFTEAKIYMTQANFSDRSGPHGMRWKKSDNTFSKPEEYPQFSVSELFAQEYQKVFTSGYNKEIRLLGNSLGGNLALATLLQLNGIVGRNQMPARITLMDPFWDPGINLNATTLPFLANYGVNATGELAGFIAGVMDTEYQTAIEYYRTSLFGFIGTSEQVAKTAAFIELKPDYAGPNPIDKHTAPVRSYLLNYKLKPGREVIKGNHNEYVFAEVNSFSDERAVGGPSVPNARVRDLMKPDEGQDRYWTQVTGQNDALYVSYNFALNEGAYPGDPTNYNVPVCEYPNNDEDLLEFEGPAALSSSTEELPVQAAILPPDNDPLLLGVNDFTTSDPGAETAKWGYLKKNDAGNYTVSYSSVRGAPNWAGWHVQTSDMGSYDVRRRFNTDNTLPSGFVQVTHADYNNSGFDRGHLCNAKDRSSAQPPYDATFLMSNVIPQNPNNNQNIWKFMEMYCRELVLGNVAEDLGNKELYIIAGGDGTGGEKKCGAFEDRFNGGSGRVVVVPKLLWKVVVVLPEGDDDINRINANTRVITFVAENRQYPGEERWYGATHIITLDSLQKLTSRQFLTNVPEPVRNVLLQYRDTSVPKNGLPVGTGSIAFEETLRDAPAIRKNEVIVYPNPVNHELHISYQLSDKKQTQIELYNSVGVLIDKIQPYTFSEAGSHQVRYRVDHLSKGIYYLKFTEQGKPAVTKKVMKMQ